MGLKYLINHILTSNFNETKFFSYSQIVDKLIVKSKLILLYNQIYIYYLEIFTIYVIY